MGTIPSVLPVAHHWHMPRQTPLLRLAAPLLVACVLALVAAPADAAAGTPAAHRAGSPSGRSHGHVQLQSDAAQPAAARRTHRASYAWRGRRILYTETIPTKWDWSLQSAIAKWNNSGGGIRFVRTTKVRKARLRISYGNIGSAAGMASVGKSRHAWVRLSSTYNSLDSLDAYNRIEVLGIFAHELGHVLGFQHTSTRCALMSPVLDVDGCGMLPASMPGYYKCRTIDAPLVSRFVQIYGGHARYPSTYCPIDPIPSAVGRVAFSGGTGSPVTVRWGKPAYVPSGSYVDIRSWSASVCGAVPSIARWSFASVSAGSWRDPQAEAGDTCFSVRLVNRYGAGRSAVNRMMRS
jgi:hypothetical protein